MVKEIRVWDEKKER